MKATAREKIPVQVQPESNPVPEAVQKHRQQKEVDEEDDELGIVKRAKESGFSAISMQDQGSNSESSVESESLKSFLNGENQQ